MSKKENKINKEKDNMGYEKQKHPAFGMIGIYNVTGGKNLFGSSVNNNHCISIEIKTATKHVNAYSEHYMGDNTVCEVLLTHSQLAEMLFSSNRGDGVPCTLRYTQQDGHIDTIPDDNSYGLKESRRLLQEKLDELFEQAKTLCTEVEEINSRKTPLKKADRERIKFIAFKIRQDIEENLKYASKCFDEKVEKTMSQAKAEFESFVNVKLKDSGIEHNKKENLVRFLEDKENE